MEDRFFESLKFLREAWQEAKQQMAADAESLWNSLDYDQRLLLACHIFSKLHDHLSEGGSYRYLIYDRLGFEPDAYGILMSFGGLDLSNALNTAREAEGSDPT